MTRVLALPGTGYPDGGDGITEHFLGLLDARFDCEIVSYPATFGGLQDPYDASRTAGIAATLAKLREQPDEPTALVGYSQGAVVVGDFAEQLMRGLHYDVKNVVAVAMIADGRRPKGGTMPNWPAAGGYGIAGERHLDFAKFPVWLGANEGDGITALPPGNPLRLVADFADWFSIRSLEDVYRWGAKVMEKILEGQMQPFWSIEYWRDWGGAAAYLRGYLWDGRHTVDYVNRGILAALAEVFNSNVR